MDDDVFQETALSEVSSAGEKERVGWFEAVSADDVEAVKDMLKESPACVNMVDEVSIVTWCLDFQQHQLHWVQWLRGRAPDSRIREPGFESCVAMLKHWTSFFTLHCSGSLGCINECLGIDSGGYVYEQPSCINCSIWLDASQRSQDGVWVNMSVKEVKCKSTLSSPEDRILRYVRTYFLHWHCARFKGKATDTPDSNVRCLLAETRWITSVCLRKPLKVGVKIRYWVSTRVLVLGNTWKFSNMPIMSEW